MAAPWRVASYLLPVRELVLLLGDGAADSGAEQVPAAGARPVRLVREDPCGPVRGRAAPSARPPPASFRPAAGARERSPHNRPGRGVRMRAGRREASGIQM